MFDDLIKTFMQAAQSGSFSKAAEELFLSPNAVKKRIKCLEQRTGVILFFRSNKGIALTKAGQFLYADFGIISKQYEQALEKARRIQHEPVGAIRIGMMSTFLDSFMTNSWHGIRKEFAQNPLHTVYYGNSLSDLDTLFCDVGKEIDLCIEIYDPDIARKYGLQVKKVSEYDLYIGVPDALQLPWNDRVSIEQLTRQTLVLPYRRRAKIYAEVWDKVKRTLPETIIEGIAEYNIRTLNDCYVNRHCILVAENQINLYPFFSFFPLEIEGSISFGIYYSAEADEQIKNIVHTITAVL